MRQPYHALANIYFSEGDYMRSAAHALEAMDEIERGIRA